jgi:hypothetical protein
LSLPLPLSTSALLVRRNVIFFEVEAAALLFDKRAWNALLDFSDRFFFNFVIILTEGVKDSKVLLDVDETFLAIAFI